ncbi:hypothetical protein PSA01_08860 [Pseudonocardia saturnea]|uniref:DUF3558 domain-containing protein n=1 Tax=Pseudonocardia saturnea TaxID=33909 RepID=A0ABQ0RT71_9PSEU|nr:hypothetical protein Pdca_01470 [Pseudonocardia autotrophica]GEC23857.1 hypothetical protein PSA01_08860 [Pseudonocardia saturnea]
MFVVGVVLAGCSGGPQGPFPDRPADIDVSTVDLCTALTAEERAELGVEAGEAKTAELNNGPTRICGWSNFDDGYNYGVQTIADGAMVAVGIPGSTVQVVDGYGVVVETTQETVAPRCALYVDVAETQALRVQVRAIKNDDAGRIPSIETVCGRAESVVSSALRNLGGAGS